MRIFLTAAMLFLAACSDSNQPIPDSKQSVANASLVASSGNAATGSTGVTAFIAASDVAATSGVGDASAPIALSSAFEFAGLSRKTSLQDVVRRYPNSTVSGSTVYVSPKDTHDHIFQITLFVEKLNDRLRISFESPDRKYPSCDSIEKSIALKYGEPMEASEFYEETIKSQRMLWNLDFETVQLQCFMSDKQDDYLAEAINVYPAEPKVEPSNQVSNGDSLKRAP